MLGILVYKIERKVAMTKIDIISGFLGAGKTTLIKKLLQEAFGKEKIVLIENEFGEIGIDAVSYTHLDVYKRQVVFFISVNFVSWEKEPKRLWHNMAYVPI